jgi:ABC-type Mn2+/Zn2+ transport system permease subunit
MLAISGVWHLFAATAALAGACAVLSIFVVARRWAFIGEGISHSAFGGAGLAWLIMLAVPGSAERAWILHLAVVAFCLTTALAIGYLSRGNRVTGDAAIGIFLVATLAFGFLAQQIFRHVTGGHDPPDFTRFLVGDTSQLDERMIVVVLLVSAAVVVTVAALGKEILAYCFDPQMAQASGVRVGLVHYLLMVLLAATIIIGVAITGPLLITALLVLPGATANLLSRQLKRVMLLAIAAAIISAIAGVALNATWHFIPTGPAIVLTLFLQFLLAYAFSRLSAQV